MNIKPENRLNMEEIGHIDTTDEPIVRMEEGVVMPLYIMIGVVELKTPIGGSIMNLMGVASYLREKDEIEVRGRMRFEATGRKTAFQMNRRFKPEELIEAQWAIKDMYTKMVKDMGLIEKEPIFELNFGKNDTTEEIIEKMNQSDKFNIGSFEKK